jgi:alpha-1,6-mannosyltransferase
VNDLAERALHGLDVARKAVLARPLPWLAAIGFLAAAVVVVSGGRIGAGPAALPLNTWLGLLPHTGYRVRGLLPGLIMIGGIAVLTLIWLAVLALAARRRVTVRAVWWTAASVGLPFVVGPPLLSTDVYLSAARGLLARQGLSPYHHGAAALHDNQRLINAIDPTWRSTHATGGPLSLALDHLFATAAAGSPLGTVLLLRGLAVVSTVAIGRLAMDLAARRRASALTITVLNPAVLLYVVSAAHVEGVLAALLLAAFVRAGQRHWGSAVVCACLAAGVKPIAFAAVLAVVLAHAAGVRRRIVWRIVARDAVIAVVVLVVCALSVPYGLDWADNISSITREHTPFAPASLASDLIGVVVSSASFDDLAVGGRVAAVLGAITAVAYLLVTVRTRPLERTVGYALLAIALLGPVLYPWYLLAGLLCLAPTARRSLRDWTIALSVAACVLDPVGFATRTAEIVTICGLAVIGAVLAVRLIGRHRRTVAAQRARMALSADA